MAKVVTDKDIGNSLTIDSNNKLNINTRAQTSSYKVSLGSGFRVGSSAEGDDRFYCVINSLTKFGYIHIDFRRTSGSSDVIGYLPPTCPTPIDLIESQLYDGSTVWVSAGQRTIRGLNLQNNRRYIVNLLGYFS